MTAGFSKQDKTESNERGFSHFSKYAVLTKNHKSKISLCWLQKTAFWNKSHSTPEFLLTPCSLEIKNSLLINDNCVIWDSYLCCNFTHASSWVRWCLGTQFSVTNLQILKKTELWKLGCLSTPARRSLEQSSENPPAAWVPCGRYLQLVGKESGFSFLLGFDIQVWAVLQLQKHTF